MGAFASWAEAQLTWNTSGPNDNWSTSDANWGSNSVWAQNSDAIFGGTGETVTVTTANIFNDLTFNTNGYTIADGAGSLKLANDNGSTVTIATGISTTIAESLADSANGASVLTKAGAGSLVLSNTSNSFSGGLTISAGSVAAGTTGVNGAGTLGTGAVSIGSTGSLTLNSSTSGATYSNSFSGTGSMVVNTGGNASNSGSTIFNGTMSSFAGTMNITGGGKALLWGNGGGATSSSATINVSANATLYVYNTITEGAAVTLNGGNTGESFGQLRVEYGATYSGNVTLAGSITDAFDSYIGTLLGTGTFSGIIGETGGSKTLSKGGWGTTVLTNANTYTGGTLILGGTLQVGNGGTIGALGSGSINTSGVLAYNRTDIVTLGSTISGSGGVTQLGTGTLKLTATNNYTGPTVVTAGILEISGSISGSLTVSVKGGTLTLSVLNAMNNTSAALTLGDSSSSTGGTLFLSGNNLADTFGAMNLSYNSTIDFGTGSGGQDLFFASVGTHTSGAKLNILNWTGTANTLGTTANDRLIFTGVATDFTNVFAQGDVIFAGFGTGYRALTSGSNYEIVAIPEPSNAALLGELLLLTAAAPWRRRLPVRR